MKVRSIPPITATGSRRRKTPALLHGLAHMSLGRYMSEMAKARRSENESDSWNVSEFARSAFNRKSKKKSAAPIIHAGRKITCKVVMLEEYNQEGDFAVKLQFEGIEYSKDVFSRCVSDKASCSFQIPVIHTIVAKGSYLLLTTIGDIFEYEIVRDIEQCCLGECHTKTATKATRETGAQEFCPNRLFRDEAYIPELLKSYDPSTMHASLEDNIVIVTYRKLVH